ASCTFVTIFQGVRSNYQDARIGQSIRGRRTHSGGVVVQKTLTAALINQGPQQRGGPNHANRGNESAGARLTTSSAGRHGGYFLIVRDPEAALIEPNRSAS